MSEPGDIVVERLTGKRAIVIRAAGPDEVTCRFTDGRLEERYTFELQPLLPFLGSFLSLVLSFFWASPRERPAASVEERIRPLLVRRSSPT
jgi:hypothetical protein